MSESFLTLQPMLEKSGGPVDPARITDRVGFAAALTYLREMASLTVRDLAKAASVPSATVSGYMSGRHLPSPTQPEALFAVLSACGVTEPRDHAAWLATLRRLRQAPQRQQGRAPSPYPGLASFQVDDAQYFFGRADLIDEVARALKRAADGSAPVGFVVLTGPSGSGKSSVMRAGLAALAAAGGVQWVLMAPGEYPCAVLAGELADRTGRSAAEITAILDAAVADNSGGERLPAEFLAEQPGLLFIDQAEELFTLCTDPIERHRFLGWLGALTSARDGKGARPVTAALALRADLYGAAASEPVLVEGLRHTQVVIGPMSREQLTEAVVGPAAVVGVHVDDALVTTLLDDLAPRDQPGVAHDLGALPLIAHALHATWSVSRRGRMTVEDYLFTGGIAGAIERSAEAVWAKLPPEAQEIARQIFLRLVFVDDGVTVTRRRATLQELGGLGGSPDSSEAPADEGLDGGVDSGVDGGVWGVDEVIERFSDARLLTLRTETVEISHEALLGAWARLRQWIDADRSALRTSRQLADAARTWMRADGDESYLLSEGRLADVTESLQAGRVTLNDTEREFLAASTRRADARRRTVRQRQLRMRTALIAVAVLAVVASGLAALAQSARVQATHRAAEATAARDDAQSRELAIAADRLRATDPALAAQLSLVAYRIAPTVDARSAVVDSTAGVLPVRLAAQEGPTFVAVDRDRRVVAVTQAVTGAIDLWSTANSRKPVRLATVGSAQPGVQQFSVAISPDGRQLAAGDAAGLVERWDISDPSAPRSLTGPGVVFPSGVLALTFSPDGRYLAAGGEGDAVQWWDVSDLEQAATQPSIPAASLVSALAWSPDSQTLWVGDGEGTVRAHGISPADTPLADPSDTADGGDTTIGAPVSAAGNSPALVELDAGPAVVSALAASPDGALLAVGDKRGELHVWQVERDQWTPVEPEAPVRVAGWLDSISFSPDGTALALGGTGNVIRVVAADDLGTQWEMAAPGPVTGTGFVSDNLLVTGSSDGMARIWPVPGPVIGPLEDIVVGVSMPTADRLVVGPSSKVDALLTYDVTDREAPRESSAPPGADDMRLAGVIAVSSDGSLTAMGSADGSVQLWDTSDMDRPVAIGGPFDGAPDYINSMAFAADERILAIGSDATVIDLWDLSDPHHPVKIFESDDIGAAVTSICFQPGGTLLAAATTGGNAILWDVADPTQPRRVGDLTGMAGYAWAAAFSPDGSMLAVGGSAREVWLWDVTDHENFAPIGVPLTGPRNDVGVLKFHPTRSTLAAATYNGVLWLWDTNDPENPELVAQARAGDGVLYSMAWAPDGSSIVAGGSARKVWSWIADPDQAAADICAAAGVGITNDEWDLYVTGIDYQPPCPS